MKNDMQFEIYNVERNVDFCVFFLVLLHFRKILFVCLFFAQKVAQRPQQSTPRPIFTHAIPFHAIEGRRSIRGRCMIRVI